MTTRIKLPVKHISLINRQRLDLGDIPELAESLKRFGLIQPIIVNQDHTLIAGGRRLAAAESLGWEEIDVVYRETMSQEELHELELEENVRRKDQTWQEKTLHISTIHALRVNKAALTGETWGQRETGELLGQKTNCVVSYALTIAAKLRAEQVSGEKKFWNCDSLTEAWRLLCRDRAAEGNALLASRQQAVLMAPETHTDLAEFDRIESNEDLLSAERVKYYQNPHNPPDSFEDYWKEKQEWAKTTKVTVNLSNSLFLGDSIKFMNDNPGRFNHVITDIPYGIEMENLTQSNPNAGMVDIDTVALEHDKGLNYKLIGEFFPAAFATTKEKGFVITWCDQMLWDYMYMQATLAGFAVQRWPITWVKTHNCINQSAAFNTTKDTEIAIVCRKPGTVLARNTQSSVIVASRDALCDEINHPFAKPFAVWETLINLATIEGESILDPFAGRGSGVISALQLRRNAFGVELNVDHYNALLESVRNIYYLRNNPNLEFK